MHRICVFAGSRAGTNPSFSAAAAELGRTLASARVPIVYGGGASGLMGALADSALAAGGEVVGVIPQALVDRELAHPGLSELIVVPDMHTRKATMAKMASGFIALPGGLGTLEELFEVLTWSQLGLHRKPVAIVDASAFYRTLFDLIQAMTEYGFLTSLERSGIVRASSVHEAVAAVLPVS